MPRYRILVEYDGAPFVGWQAQANGPSVQSALEEALFRFCGERARVQGAGRTDAGVHAEGQAAHLDLERARPPNVLRDAVNHHLGSLPVCVLDAEEAAPDFHARFSAVGRAYRYRILNRRAPPALDRGRVWHVGAPLDAGAMAEAAGRLLGRHDFSSFRSSECQAASPVRTLDRLDVRREGEEVVLHVEARSFLHHQVRIIAGTLREAGIGKRTPDTVSAALHAASRPAAGPTAPPHGLCLTRVRY